MARFFNTTGPCDPEMHFMLPTEPRLPRVRPLIDKELYFGLHAPRQSGKTTCFRALARTLVAEGKYAALFDRRSTAAPLEERSEISELEHQGRRIRLLRL